MCRLVVVLQDRTFVYDLNKTTILEEIETVPNTKGIDPTAALLPNIHTIAPANIFCCQAGTKTVNS
jgi:autophagy-related protein 18